MFEKLEQLINAKKIKAFFLSRDVLVFSVFLLISFSFWFLHGLRKTYEASFPVAIEYTDIPIAKVNESDLPQTIKVTIKDQGGRLMSYKMTKQKTILLSIKEDFTEEKTRFVIHNYYLKSRIKEQLYHTAEIVRLIPETIIIPIVEKSQKKVPVKHGGKIGFAQQHNISDSVQITPPYITIYGDKKVIDNIHYVQTESLKLKNLKDTVRKMVYLQPMNDVQFSVNQVDILIPVEKFTEKTLEIPITSKNFPANAELRTFPSTLKVSFTVTFSKFNTVNANDFIAVIDYNDIIHNQNGRLTPNVKTNNPFVSHIRISPAEVEYLIEKK